MSVERSSYVRQLTARELRQAAQWLGANDDTTWDSTKDYFHAEWDDIDPPGLVGCIFTPTGSAETFDTAKIPRPNITIRVHDWDVALLMKLEAWKFAKTQLRWYAPAQHVAIVYINGIKEPRPLKGILEVTFLCTSIWFPISATGHLDADFQPWPSAIEQATGQLYGDALATIPPPGP
jgi:hypothetical protein